MGLFDDIRNKAEDLAEEHGDKIVDGIDKAADLADQRTGGQHGDKIDSGAEKAKAYVQKLAEPGRQGTGDEQV
jgi:hypothetical protein